MCFVLSCNTSLIDMEMVERLSGQITDGCVSGICNSCNNDSNQAHSAVTLAVLLYLTSVDERLTVGCFFF